MAANEHDIYNKTMSHRSILESIPIVSVWTASEFTSAYIDIVSVRIDPTISGSHPTLRPGNRNRDDRLGRRFRMASSPSNPTDWTQAAYGKNSTGSTLRRRAR